jgi:hypothetical protein
MHFIVETLRLLPKPMQFFGVIRDPGYKNTSIPVVKFSVNLNSHEIGIVEINA